MTINSDLLVGSKVYLRKMEERDALYIVRWRNEQEIKKWFLNQNRLTFEEHMKWFIKKKTDRLDYIICVKKTQQPIGTLNYKNIKKDKAEVGKMLGNKEYWGRDFAKEAYFLWLKVGFNVLKLKHIYAQTMVKNIPNIKLNEKFGFKVIAKIKVKLKPGLEEDFFIMRLKSEEFIGK
jgi:RimJ/RimL family protein N-acetyltransferase